MTMRILILCSSGGHLTQAWGLKPFWEQHERIWVTMPTIDARGRLEDERVIEAHYPTVRHLPNLVRNFGLAQRVLTKYRPHVLLSTGAAISVPFFFLAKFHRIRTIHVEPIDRFDRLSLSGKLLYPFSDHFLVQWQEIAELIPGSRNIGLVL